MRIGALRRRLAVLREVTADDGAGGVVRSLVADGAVFAAVEPVGRGEAVRDGRNVGVVTHRVTVRGIAPVERGVVLGDGTRRLRVVATETDAARRWRVCQCVEEEA